jgi:DNA-directed RNA polymerase sigma subunit (sigma70/sigma32)
VTEAARALELGRERVRKIEANALSKLEKVLLQRYP